MFEYKKTSDVAHHLGITYYRLFSLVRSGIVPPPQRRDSSGHYWWSEEEVELARRSLEVILARKKSRPADAVLGQF